MYDAKLSSRSVIHDSAGSAGRTMAEDLENPEDKVRGNSISAGRPKQLMRTATAPPLYMKRQGSHSRDGSAGPGSRTSTSGHLSGSTCPTPPSWEYPGRGGHRSRSPFSSGGRTCNGQLSNLIKYWSLWIYPERVQPGPD